MIASRKEDIYIIEILYAVHMLTSAQSHRMRCWVKTDLFSYSPNPLKNMIFIFQSKTPWGKDDMVPSHETFSCCLIFLAPCRSYYHFCNILSNQLSFHFPWENIFELGKLLSICQYENSHQEHLEIM